MLSIWLGRRPQCPSTQSNFAPSSRVAPRVELLSSSNASRWAAIWAWATLDACAVASLIMSASAVAHVWRNYVIGALYKIWRQCSLFPALTQTALRSFLFISLSISFFLYFHFSQSHNCTVVPSIFYQFSSVLLYCLS